MKQYLLAFVCLLTCIQSSACTIENESCVATEEWRFSVSLGAGTITNPLYSGKNIPLVVIPNFNYYGEKFFLENNTLGYTIKETATWSFSFISQINREKLFFASDSSAALLLPSNAFLEGSFMSKDANLDYRDVEKRKWSIDGGIQINGFFENGYYSNFQLLKDISKVHHGSNALLELGKNIHIRQLAKTNITWSIGALWSSQKLMNYYYGIPNIKLNDNDFSYQAKDSLNPYVKLNILHKINKNWSTRLSLKREFLSNSYQHSPLINDEKIDIIFAGVSYAF